MALPAPSEPTASFTIPFVGRDKELALLQTSLAHQLAGFGQVVLLAGEPGMGKTRLVEEFAAIARTRDARVLWGRADERDGTPPFWPWIQLLRPALRGRDAGWLKQVCGPGAGAITQILPEFGAHYQQAPAAPVLDPASARFRLFDGITTLLRQLAREQPLVLVLDDLHWADTPSLLLLPFLVQEIRDSPILLVGTYRDEDVGRQHPLATTLAELARSGIVQRVTLHGLSRPEVACYIALTTEHSARTPFVEAVYQQTDGNPFFVAEVVRLIATDERSGKRMGERGWSARVPESIKEVIRQRLRWLSTECTRVLALASVIGQAFNLPLLEQVAGRTAVDLIELLDEGLAARVVQDDGAPGRYRFSHALIQQTLYEDLPSAQRARLHGDVGTILARSYSANLAAQVDALAHHFFHAGPAGDVSRAVTYSVRAGGQASGQFAWENAAGHYERALQLVDLLPCPNERQRCELLMSLGADQWRSGDSQAGEDSYQQAADLARGLSLPEHCARAVLGQTGADLVGAGALARRNPIGALEQALADLPAVDSVLRARLLSRLAESLSGWRPDARRATELAGAALEMAQRLDDPYTLLSVLLDTWWVLQGPDTLAEQERLIPEFDSVAAKLNDPMVWLMAYGVHSIVTLWRGDLTAFDRSVDQFSSLADHLRLPTWQTAVVSARMMRAWMEGRLADAEQLASTLPQILRGDETLGFDQLAHLFVIRRWQGRSVEIEDELRRLAHVPAQLFEHDPESVRFWDLALGVVQAESGRTTSAEAVLERSAAHDFGDAVHGIFWLLEFALAAELCALLEDSRRAALLYDLLMPYADRYVCQPGTKIYFGATAYYLGLLASTDHHWGTAEAHFERALVLDARAGALPFIAQTQHAWAALLLRRNMAGDRERARELLNSAIATARELGIVSIVVRAVPLLESIEPPAAPSGDTAPSTVLSKRELDVLRLLVDGQSNQEIAAALHISRRTVVNHVANMMNKLGLDSRTAVATWAVRQGLA